VNLRKRIAKLETTVVAKRDNRLILRFEGPGSEHMPQPEATDDEAQVFTIRFVEARDGRPA